MTNAINYRMERRIPEIFLYQIARQYVSSPIFIHQLVHDLFTPEHLASIHITKKPISVLTPREQLLLISTFFNFPKSKLGKIFDVTRQSIYDWFDNKNISSENYQKIKRLSDVVLEVDPEPSQQIFHIYANEVLEGYDKSLFEYLLDDDFDKNKIVELSKTIYEMSKERWRRIDKIPEAKYGSQNSEVP